MGDGCVEKSAGVAEQLRIICERQGVHFLDAKDCEFNKVDFMHLTRKGHTHSWRSCWLQRFLSWFNFIFCPLERGLLFVYFL